MIPENESNSAFLRTVFPFNLLNDEEMSQISPLFEKGVVPQGQSIFQVDNPVDGFYVIMTGKVLVKSVNKKKSQQVFSLSTGDHFGEDSLGRIEFRKQSAVALTRVIYLKCSTTDIYFLIKTFPDIDKAFKILLRTYQLQSSTPMPWRTTSESIQMISRRHIFFFFMRILVITGLGLVLFAFFLFQAFVSKEVPGLFTALSIVSLLGGVLFAGWAALEWTNDFLIITSERVLIQKKLIGFFESRQESPLSAILSTGLDTSMWGRIIGFGSVSVRSYTGTMRSNNLPSPELIFELLENHRQRVLRESHLEERAGMRDTLEERLAAKATQKVKVGNREVRNQLTSAYESSDISDRLAEFFNLRYEKDGTIIYHTHWLILLRKTFYPVLFNITVVVLVLLKIFGGLGIFSEAFVFGAAIILTVFGWGWWFYQFQDWQNDIYIITKDQLIDVYRKPLGTEDRRSAPIKNIQTVEFLRKGIIGLILNFGTVRIQIGNEELTFDNVYNPSKVQSEIYARFKEYGEDLKQKDQERIADWIKTYDDIKYKKTGGSFSGKETENE
jgi:CRP-like cAMP-binding protein